MLGCFAAAHWQPRLRRAYEHAEAIVTVSNGVAGDLSAWTSLSGPKIATICNPAVTEKLIAKQREPVDHLGVPPGIASAGRLGRKDHPTLIRAFA